MLAVYLEKSTDKFRKVTHVKIVAGKSDAALRLIPCYPLLLPMLKRLARRRILVRQV